MALLPKRISSWLIVIWTALFAIWIIAAIASRPSTDCVSGDQLCQDASDAGTGIGVGILFFLWFLGFVVLSLIWLMTRTKRRVCPVCGTEVKKGPTQCPSCSFDFAAAAGAQAAAPPEIAGTGKTG
jgi:hypothetical protein